MDKLAAIILHGSKSADKKLLKDLLIRAEINRIPLLYLKTVSKFQSDTFISSQLKIWEQKKRNYDMGFQKILQMLNNSDIQFMLVKHAQYPRASYDVDILFRNIEEYEKAMPILRETVRLGLIRPDPHVGGLRDMRGCTIVIPTKDLWTRRSKKNYFGIEVNIPSIEDQIILFHLHMLKHREIFLGDVISTLHLYNTEHNAILLYRLVDKYSLMPTFHFVSCLFHYLRLREPEITLKMPLLSQFINFLAYEKSQELFPIRVPKFILGLSVLHFSPR
jgi:hypothetical protein